MTKKFALVQWMLLRISTPWLLLLTLAGLLVAAGGCSSSSSPNSHTVANSATGVSVLLAASELLVGENRFPFGVVTRDGQLIEGAEVNVRFYKLQQDGSEVLKAEAEAIFRVVLGMTPHRHEDGQIHLHEEVRGVYVVDRAIFEEPGIWRARLEVASSDASVPQRGSLAFQVKEQSATLNVGDRVPPSRNPTASDVEDLTEITTHYPVVPGLYELTVADALKQDKPFVVIFATPAFCTSRMCGPMTDVVAQVYDHYKDRVSFIHIEPWKLDVARTEGRLEMTGVASEWSLPSEPWVFVIDTKGRVSARFEGLVSADELATALGVVIP